MIVVDEMGAVRFLNHCPPDYNIGPCVPGFPEQCPIKISGDIIITVKECDIIPLCQCVTAKARQIQPLVLLVPEIFQVRVCFEVGSKYRLRIAGRAVVHYDDLNLPQALSEHAVQTAI